MNFFPAQFSYLLTLLVAGAIFHALLWARNARFLWSQWAVIFKIILIAEVWMLMIDPVGGHWRAWVFDPDKVLGIWFWQVAPIEDFVGIAVTSSAAACAVLVFGYSPRHWV